jgi:iron complex outermembrane receptor protein
MRGFLFSAALCALVPFAAAAAVNETDVTSGNAGNIPAEEEINDRLDSVVVSASRAGKSTPVTYTMVSRQQLRQNNPINSLPMMLNLQPSVVSVNEGGTGLGYSKMTIRGSKGSQVNVTLNGITLNDAESQEVFWVNIPALTSLISSGARNIGQRRRSIRSQREYEHGVRDIRSACLRGNIGRVI